MRSIQKIVVVFLLTLLPQLTSAQCAMCRAVLESEAAGGASDAINDGIVYLMIWPYILIGGVGFVIYRMIKKASTSN